MKSYFEFSLQGRDWWKPWIAFWVLFVALYVPLVAIQGRNAPPQGNAGVYLAVQLLFMLAMMLLSAVFTVVFLRLALPRLSIAGDAFAFQGSIGGLVKLYLVGYLLTIVTLGIYFPWYLRRITAYLASQTGFRGTSPEFLGKGGTLFKYFLLALVLPVIVMSIAIGVVAGLGYAGDGGSGLVGLGMLTFLLILLIMAPFYYLLYKWLVNYRWREVTITWRTSFWPSVYFLFVQVVLSLITVGIYAPAAFLKCWRYFSERTALARPDGEAGHLGFEGAVGQGFGLFWGQALLTLVTLGIYAPWAYANVGRWLMKGTYFEAAAATATAATAPAAGGP